MDKSIQNDKEISEIESPKFENYLTFWGLLVGSIATLSCIIFNKKTPLWVLLSAAGILTSVCIIGTFFCSVPEIRFYDNKKIRETITKDAIYHSMPLLVFLLIFTVLVKRTKPIKKSNTHFGRNFFGKKCNPLESNYFILASIPALLVGILYLLFGNPEICYHVRPIDIIIIIVLLLTVFFSSFQIYFNWSNFILNK